MAGTDKVAELALAAENWLRCTRGTLIGHPACMVADEDFVLDARRCVGEGARQQTVECWTTGLCHRGLAVAVVDGLMALRTDGIAIGGRRDWTAGCRQRGVAVETGNDDHGKCSEQEEHHPCVATEHGVILGPAWLELMGPAKFVL